LLDNVSPLQISASTLSTCLGHGLDAHRLALREGRSGLKPCDFETVRLDTWIGEVDGIDAVTMPSALSEFDCRNNRLALLGLHADGFADRVREAVDRYGPARVGVFLGTSTSGILETEIAYRHRDPVSGALPPALSYHGSHNPFSVTDFTRRYLGLEGMALTISTACSSSAKVFAAAARQMALGVIDAAVVGGVDSLCLTTLYGFASLQLTSTQPCRPFDPARDGISIGEAAAFALLERPGTGPRSNDASGWLLGVGESSDAHRMSAPHPQGLGAAWRWRPPSVRQDCSRPIWITSTFMAPPRPPMMRPKAWPSRVCLATVCHAVPPRAPPVIPWAQPVPWKRWLACSPWPMDGCREAPVPSTSIR